MSTPEIDDNLAQGWLTRAEAYLLFSKMKRGQTATMQAFLALSQGDRLLAQKLIADAHTISLEIEPLLNGLVYGPANGIVYGPESKSDDD